MENYGRLYNTQNGPLRYEHSTMKKVNVIGTTGSGKSVFSKLLSNKIDCSYIQMDQLFWKPDWVESTDEEFIAKVTQATSGDSWVLDGNFSRTNEIKWKNVDTIIWIDYSYGRTLFQLFSRTIWRVLSKQELWPETGNRESLRRSFLSKKSILVWFFKNYRRNKNRYSALMSSDNVKHLELVRLRSPKDANRFLRESC